MNADYGIVGVIAHITDGYLIRPRPGEPVLETAVHIRHRALAALHLECGQGQHAARRVMHHAAEPLGGQQGRQSQQADRHRPQNTYPFQAFHNRNDYKSYQKANSLNKRIQTLLICNPQTLNRELQTF